MIRFKGMNVTPTSCSKRLMPPERGMTYGTRVLRLRSRHSTQRLGEPTTRGRATGGRPFERGRVRDAQLPEPSGWSSTGKLIEIERLTISLEEGRWKSTRKGNSLATYPTPFRHRVAQAYASISAVIGCDNGDVKFLRDEAQHLAANEERNRAVQGAVWRCEIFCVRPQHLALFFFRRNTYRKVHLAPFQIIFTYKRYLLSIERI